MGDTFRQIPLDVARARALFDRLRAADGRAPESPPGPGVSTVFTEYDDVSGDLIALAWRPDPADPAELYVDPRFRNRGIGARLAAALRAGAADGADPGIWAHGTFPAAVHLAEAAGAAPVRELLQMRAPLPAPETEGSTPPPGVTMRTFVPGADDAEFLRVNAAAFAWHPEQGRLTQQDLDAQMAEPWFDADGFFLAVAADPATVLGFHWTKVHPAGSDDAVPIGEIYVLAVDPASPVRHLGGPLTAVGLDHLAGRGLRLAMLYVEADNEPALKLYRRFGFAEYTRDTVFATNLSARVTQRGE